ncbi:MAG: alpha/beta fold hydrolase, partial [Candidatus Dormibacteria bacterium]
MLSGLRREGERSALRVWNGSRHLAGVGHPRLGATPRRTVWTRDSAELWRYGTGHASPRPPILLVPSVVSRSYVMDLLPGNSMVEFLLRDGFDVFLLDWGEPDASDAANTLATYCEDYLPAAISAVLREARADRLGLVGYCLGGVMSLLALAASPHLPVSGLALLAPPVDFRHMGHL